jgi:hypothetical protein
MRENQIYSRNSVTIRKKQNNNGSIRHSIIQAIKYIVRVNETGTSCVKKQ